MSAITKGSLSLVICSLTRRGSVGFLQLEVGLHPYKTTTFLPLFAKFSGLTISPGPETMLSWISRS
jgi:hypothetical protein